MKPALEPVVLRDFAPFTDVRGSFQKVFRSDQLKRYGFKDAFRESFISFSKPGVLRGMHFQLPPHDHWKLVTCVKGKILDVCVDVRKGGTYGTVHSFELSQGNGHSLLIPPGFAHGFLTYGEEEAGVLYLTSSEHDPKTDSGIRWDSFGFEWNEASPPLVSNRDQGFVSLKEFASPWSSE